MQSVKRIQTGVRIDRGTLKVLKALAEYLDLSLGDLLEGVVLHAFEGKSPFSVETLKQIAQLKTVYDLNLSAKDAHALREDDNERRRCAAKRVLTRQSRQPRLSS